jgi:superfamily II DNA or RNA helicase
MIAEKPNGRTYLSNRGYAIEKKGNEAIVKSLKVALTVSPKINQMMVGAGVPISFEVYRENEDKLYIPKFYGLQKFGIPQKNKMKDGIDTTYLQFNGKIRPEQEQPAKAFLDAIQDPLKMGGIISLPCGYGKTILALYLASIIKKKTIVICHKEFLGNQWKDRITEFLPNARIGKIKQNIIDVDDRDIVIASLQSVAMKDYDEAIFKDFGFAIFDEAHHLSAEVFSCCLPKTTCKRMLGLSATLKRKDGLSKVFEWYLGTPLYEIKRDDNDLKVIVKRFYDPAPEYCEEVRMGWSGKLNSARMINNVCQFAPRNEMICQTIVDLLNVDPGRQILVLSERRNQLFAIQNILKDTYHITSIGYYVGGMKQVDLDKSALEKIILGTFQLAQEGMDVPTLNTLILASPVSSIEQAIGRIQRQKKHARLYQPLVIDVLDEFSMFEGQGRKRLAFYRKNKYETSDKYGADETEADAAAVPKYEFVVDPDEFVANASCAP